MKKPFAAMVAMLVAGTVWAQQAGPRPPSPSLKGKVLEVQEAEPYTYLRIKTGDGETWAAVNKTPIKAGAEVTIDNPMVMTNFESKALKRKFDRIVFGTVGGAVAGAPPAAGGPGAPSAAGATGDPHGGAGKAAEVADVKVPKASGPDARTVAEIVGKSAQLKDKPVTVRGKAVKVNSGVMGKNWVHLRDGTGSSADRTNDLLVTTKDTVQVGDIVIAKGVVRTDVDIGSGYTYKVLVDGASLKK